MSELSRLFRRLSLSVKLITSYLVILGVGGLAITVVGSWIVSSTIMAEARRTVKHDLAIARAVYQQELDILRLTLDVATTGIAIPALLARGDTVGLRTYLDGVRGNQDIDYVSLATQDGRVLLRTASRDRSGPAPGRVIGRALETGDAVAGAEVLPLDWLGRENPGLPARARIPIRPTARSAPRTAVDAAPGIAGPGPARGSEADLSGPDLGAGLVLTAAAPVRSPGGEVVAVVYAGDLVNGDFDIVDRVWSKLYRDESRAERGDGTVTIFLDDVRVSTNVRTDRGERALGTRVSQEVREAVLDRGQTWNGRAFVVDEWFITAYEPLRGLDGEIIGMLYVGLPEASYVATRNGVILSFLFIASVGFLLVLAVTYLGIQRMTRPLGQMVEATKSIATGDFDRAVVVDPGSDGEIARLAGSFNLMLRGLRGMRADLEEWGGTLEEKVQERTDELVRMQSRVAQSERLASIGMLAAGVAHEVNNPLGGILALTALTLEDLPQDDPNRENLEEVVRQTERCRDIVKHLLEFSRQDEVSIAEVDLNETLDRTLSLLRRQSLFFNIEIVKELDPTLPHVMADAAQLQQVFMNILMNAVQAMDERGTLTIRTRTVSGGREIEIEVGDTGRGIPPEHLNRIFDPFFTTGKDGQGTGLGLSIAYGIVSRHRGSISADSAPDMGTTFRIRLPVATHPATETGPAGEASGVRAAGGPYA